MTDDFQVVISRLMLSPKAIENLRTQIKAIEGLTVQVRAEIDQSQLQGIQQQTAKTAKGFKDIEGSSQKITAGTARVADNTGKMAKNMTVGAHQHNKIAQQMGVWQQFSIAMARVPVWMAAMTAFYFPLRSFQQGLETIREIDKQMTNLRKVTEGTTQEFREFANEAAMLGVNLGKTVQDVIQVSVEFARLGFDMKQSMMLAEESLMLANVGVMTIEESTRALIATVKGFGVAIDEQGQNVRRTVDMINEVGNNFAISQHGISEALRRSSASLRESGNEMEEALGLIVAAI